MSVKADSVEAIILDFVENVRPEIRVRLAPWVKFCGKNKYTLLVDEERVLVPFDNSADEIKGFNAMQGSKYGRSHLRLLLVAAACSTAFQKEARATPAQSENRNLMAPQDEGLGFLGLLGSSFIYTNEGLSTSVRLCLFGE
jgi:hypothetical protein